MKILLILVVLIAAGAAFFYYCGDGGCFSATTEGVNTGPPEPPGEGTQDSGITGIVLLGPQCPVVRVFEDEEQCRDKPYTVRIDIFKSGLSGGAIATVLSDDEGKFRAELTPGNYTLKARGGSPYPSCKEETATVTEKSFTEVTLLCDTGIR